MDYWISLNAKAENRAITVGGVVEAVVAVRAAVAGRIPDIGAARMIWRSCPPVLSSRRTGDRFNSMSKRIIVYKERERLIIRVGIRVNFGSINSIRVSCICKYFV